MTPSAAHRMPRLRPELAATCGQCGLPWRKPACRPTHAAIKAELSPRRGRLPQAPKSRISSSETNATALTVLSDWGGPEKAAKRPKRQSPTSRTMRRLKRDGWTAGIVEKRNPKMKFKTHDFLGCIDIIACRPGEGIFGIQACADASHATRRTKAIAEPKLREWLESGGRFQVWSWGKKGGRGERKLWTVRVEEIREDMLP